MHACKTIHELTVDDLSEHRVWEYALNCPPTCKEALQVKLLNAFRLYRWTDTPEMPPNVISEIMR